LREEPSVAFCVPSGNFGNLTAGVLAWRWGLPVSRFIAATNRNDVVPSYLRTGVFTPRVSVATYSNAMDVGNPSNFERLLFLFDNDRHAMSACIHEEVVTDQETVDTITAVYRATGMLLDPHTAVGYLAAQRAFAAADADPTANAVISLATAHPGKFQEIVEPATGARPTLPNALQRLVDLPKHSVVIESTLSSLTKLLRDRYT
jgi:threonine synthase